MDSAPHLSKGNVPHASSGRFPLILPKQAAPFQPIFIICFKQIPWLSSLQSIDVWTIFLDFFPMCFMLLVPPNTAVPLDKGPDLTPSGMLNSQQYLSTKFAFNKYVI